MHDTENNDVVISATDYLMLVQLLSCKFQSKLSLMASLVGAGVAAYAARSFGMQSDGTMMIGIFVGFVLGALIDLIRLRIRVAKALALVMKNKNDA